MSERASSVQRKSVKGFLKAFISIAQDHLKNSLAPWKQKKKKEMYIYNYLMKFSCNNMYITDYFVNHLTSVPRTVS